MKFLIAIMALVSLSSAHADMAGIDFGLSQGSRPTYSADWEIQRNTPSYLDLAFATNKDGQSMYTSAGYQGDYLNFGLGAQTAFNQHSITRSFGPEIGVMYNLTPLVYVKENNNYLLTTATSGSFGATISIGLNF